MMSENLVSSPIEANARANHQVLRPASRFFVSLTRAGGSRNDNTNEAATNASTNLGNRSQTMAALGPRPDRPGSFRLHQIVRMNAASPIRTFCESFTTTPAFRATPLIISPAATTDAL